MERKFKKLDAAKVAELEKYDKKPLDAKALEGVAGGSFGAPSCCPECGSYRLQVIAELIQGGYGAGHYNVFLYCPACDYEEYWGEY